MEWELTDEERWAIEDEEDKIKAQAKKLVEWFFQPCERHDHGGGAWYRKECAFCWRELRRQVGLE